MTDHSTKTVINERQEDAGNRTLQEQALSPNSPSVLTNVEQVV